MSKGNIISSIILVCLIAFIVIRKTILVNKAVYAKGVIYKYGVVAKGQHYINYSFIVNGAEYLGSMPVEFCLNTSCNIGDTVVVRYQKDNPAHSDLVHETP